MLAAISLLSSMTRMRMVESLLGWGNECLIAEAVIKFPGKVRFMRGGGQSLRDRAIACRIVQPARAASRFRRHADDYGTKEVRPGTSAFLILPSWKMT